jgi:hypothetical protein
MLFSIVFLTFSYILTSHLLFATYSVCLNIVNLFLAEYSILLVVVMLTFFLSFHFIYRLMSLFFLRDYILMLTFFYKCYGLHHLLWFLVSILCDGLLFTLFFKTVDMKLIAMCLLFTTCYIFWISG